MQPNIFRYRESNLFFAADRFSPSRFAPVTCVCCPRAAGGRFRAISIYSWPSCITADSPLQTATRHLAGYQNKIAAAWFDAFEWIAALQLKRCADQKYFTIANIGKSRSSIKSGQDFLKTLLDKTSDGRHHSAHLKRASQHSTRTRTG